MCFDAGTVTFALFFLFRYVRLIVGIYANSTYRAYPILKKPRYCREDVTVVVPTTFKSSAELMACLESILNCNPARLVVVTADAHVEEVKDLCRQFRSSLLDVLGLEHLNKRHQLLRGLEYVDTEIVVFADDNVIWPSGYLPELLAVFENPSVGAGGTRQHVRRSSSPSMWNFLGISYLERRVWNSITTQAIDGSISTLSGRTAAYRTKILKTDTFFDYFATKSWLGRTLNSDDDKCLTRYLYSNGWQIALQSSTSIETTMEEGWKYIEQCKRWARAHWRGNLTVMSEERYWYSSQYLWGFYAIYVGQFQTPALVVDSLMFWLLQNSLSDIPARSRTRYLLALACWVLFTKIVKLMPYLWRYPQDIIFIPVSILFGYLHGFINIFSLLTLHVTTWGSQRLDRLERSHTGDDSCLDTLSRNTLPTLMTKPLDGRLDVKQRGQILFNHDLQRIV